MTHTLRRNRGHATTGTLLIIGVLLFLLVPVLLSLTTSLIQGTVETSIALVEIFGIESETR